MFGVCCPYCKVEGKSTNLRRVKASRRKNCVTGKPAGRRLYRCKHHSKINFLIGD